MPEKIKNWVTKEEVDALRKAAKQTRYTVRNELIILMMYRHGLRVSELCKIQLEQINLTHASIYIKRLKNGVDGTHPIAGDELRLIRRYLRERKTALPWFFVSERQNQLSRITVNKMIEQCAKLSPLPHINPHMLRHGCGYYLVNKGYNLREIQDYLGHADIRNTVIYTRLSGNRFIGMWE